jgi:hypothetical protein
VTVPVGLDQLRAEAAKYEAPPYLLTVSDDGRPHPVSVLVSWQDDELKLLGGTRSRANASARPDVTLLWPAREDGGFCLIVDGRASVEGEEMTIRPISAILHRSHAASEDRPEGSQCEHILSPEPV